ncbi:Sorbicillinoid biosynthetic cluster transcription factor 2 [Pseudocercospora fuligena]|uniref:Sorbicillinoid biosynthetic cluster transcription factor 2 n=1 Tax=Pseudocercospora fuligena TaxID=685502 RepID=A0A8H6R9N6_9PEZI|nr:Sorbicillinoid biosynthetic cluster transcription factor 2 [Pseudocercospora fuligena]
MQALKDRIAFLESRLEPLAAIGEAEQDDSRSIPRLPTGPPDLMANEDVQHTASSPAHAAGQANHSSPIYPIIGPTESDESGEGFFGSSSAGTFMQSVNALVEQRLRGKVAHRAPILQPFGSGLVVPRSPGRQPPRVNPAEHSLPLRKVANELMDVYWQAVHSMLPILDRRQTQLQYESLWTGEGEFANQSRFLCLVNAMFALSCQLNPAEQPPERALMASTYYSRAMSLLDVWQTPSLRTVQSLVLLAMFSQSSNEPHQCWILTGIAIRVSQALGIHLPETGERGKGTQSRELIRLVWHACVQLGRTVSMTYGRPCGVGERLAAGLPFPLPADCEHDLGVPVTTTEYFNLSTKLYQDLHEVLYSLCAPGVIQVRSLDELYDRYFRHVTSDPTKPSIIDIDGDLQRWHDSIPDKLKASAFDVASEESVIHRQAVILEQK